MYLPQFHCIPENDAFWGNGFTDWVTVKKAKPLYEGHIQPRVPLNSNYYDLSKAENVKWQADLAKKYGIDGFGVYHYWFNNDKNLLTKPAEIIRDHDDIDIAYFLAWDNCSWIRSWSNVAGNAWAPTAEDKPQTKKGPQILINYIPGGEKDWENHYQYLRTHFHSKKYIKVDNKPVFIILNYSKVVASMARYMDKLAKEDGFDGLFVIYRNLKHLHIPQTENVYNYEPHTAGWTTFTFWDRVRNKLKRTFKVKKKTRFFSFDGIWKKMINNLQKNDNPHIIPGAFVGYDDSPRRGHKGAIIVQGSTPTKFHDYLKTILKLANDKKKPFLFLTAWNEWGEGAYLEPDTINKYQYLEAIKAVRQELNQ